MKIPNENSSRVLPLLVPVIALCGCGQFTTHSQRTWSDSKFPGLHGREDRSFAAESTRHDPGRAASRSAFARRLENRGELDGAIEQYKRLAHEFPENSQAFHRLGVLHDKIGQSEKSARFYLTAMHLAPKNPEIRCDYGYSRYIQGDLGMAEAALRQAIQLDASHARAHNNLGLVLARRGNDEDAIASFREAGLSKDEAAMNLRGARTATRLSRLHSVAPTRR